MPHIPLQGKTVVCLATQAWDEHWTPVQQVMLRLAPDYRVLYVEPFHPVLSWWRGSNKTLRTTRKERVPRLRRISENLYVYRPSHWFLPWNMRSKLAHRINSWLYRRQIQQVLTDFDAFPAVLWAFFAQCASVLTLDFDAIIYDCVDDWPSFFPQPREKAFVAEMDEALCRAADAVFVGSKPLLEKKRAYNPHMLVVNHAADVQHFGKAADPATSIPADLAAIPTPRVGFIGMMDSVRFDAELVTQIATQLGHHVVLVGGTMPGADNLIPKHPMIHRIGMRKVADLPSYLKGMDVLLMPYARNEATRTIYPLKLYEYLATGKPVVTTDIPAVHDLRDLMYVGEGEEFLTLVEQALAENDLMKIKMRQERASHHTWEAHVQQKLAALGGEAQRLPATPAAEGVLLPSEGSPSLTDQGYGARQIFLCLFLLLCSMWPGRMAKASGLTTADPPAAATQATAPGEYFPLVSGTRWVLRNSRVKSPVVLSVRDSTASGASVFFENPWFNSTFLFHRKGGTVVLEALDVHGLRAPMPPETVYFDFDAAQGRSWKNAIGTIQVVDRDRTIEGFQHCVQFQETNKQGQKNYWAFAPGVGPVQFGEGSGAFVLSVSESSLPGREARPPAPVMADREEPKGAAASVPAIQANAGWGRVRVALANNTSPNEWLTPMSVNRRFQQAVDAGVNYVYLSPKWDELETSPRKYKFSDIDFQVNQAERANLPLILHIRVVDTNRSTLPSDLQGRSFDDAEVRDRLLSLIDAIAPHLKNRVAYCLFGNEIDGYFKARPSEVQPYATLFRAARARVQQRFRGAPTSLTITFDGLSMATRELKPLLDQGDFFSLTYYPLRPDFTVRSVDSVEPDLQQVLRTAGKRRVLLQEVGYPSSALNGSSEEKQAEVFRRILAAVAGARERYIGVDFLFMSDFSEKVTSDLARNYNLPNATKFKAFLQTLGMFDGTGRAKKSWSVFQADARKLAQP